MNHVEVQPILPQYALIDTFSGFVWYVGHAASPEQVCADADLVIGNEHRKYAATHQLAANESGYQVYAAPAGFTCDDGSEQANIDAVAAMPLIGLYHAVEETIPL